MKPHLELWNLTKSYGASVIVKVLATTEGVAPAASVI